MDPILGFRKFSFYSRISAAFYASEPNNGIRASCIRGWFGYVFTIVLRVFMCDESSMITVMLYESAMITIMLYEWYDESVDDLVWWY